MKTEITDLLDGTYVEAVVGYRIWKMFGDHGSMFLSSVWHPANWDDTTRQLHSECNCSHPVEIETGFKSGGVIRGRATPREHLCGIYAWDRPRTCDHNYYVAGEVRLWGNVHIHEHGYRAEHAQIAALFSSRSLSPALQKRIELAALTYDVPVVTLDTLEEVKL